MKNNIQEIFALPIGVEEVKDFPGPNVYTSDSLKKRYIKSMEKSDRASELSSKISELVNRRLIVPCFLTKNVFRFAISKMFSTSVNRSIMGMYMPDKKKIFLLIDNNINLFGFASNDWLASLTIHEGIHMFSDNKPSEFYNLFKNELLEFYSYVFTKIFQLKKIDNRRLENILKFIQSIEMNMNVDNSTLKSYWKRLLPFKKDSNLDEKKFDKTLQDYIVIIKIFWKDLRAFMFSMRNYNHILGPLYTTYSDIFSVRPSTTAIQELIAPSEIISILSEGTNRVTPKILKAFKKI